MKLSAKYGPRKRDDQLPTAQPPALVARLQGIFWPNGILHSIPVYFCPRCTMSEHRRQRQWRHPRLQSFYPEHHHHPHHERATDAKNCCGHSAESEDESFLPSSLSHHISILPRSLCPHIEPCAPLSDNNCWVDYDPQRRLQFTSNRMNKLHKYSSSCFD